MRDRLPSSGASSVRAAHYDTVIVRTLAIPALAIPALVVVLLCAACSTGSGAESDTAAEADAGTGSDVDTEPGAESNTAAEAEAGSQATTESSGDPDSTEATAEAEEAPASGGASDLQVDNPEEALSVILELFNDGRTLSSADYDELLADGFKAQVPFAMFDQITNVVRQEGPWELVETQSESATEAVYLIENLSGARATIAVQTAAGQINALLVQNQEPAISEPASAEEALAVIGEAGSAAFVAAEVLSSGVSSEPQCQVVNEQDATTAMPIGSVFKLVVLAAVVDAVNDNTLAWLDDVEIREELDSYPSGVIQDVPAGEVRTVRELAELMISISDNTATDHLIDLVGREQVEAAQARWGLSTELNTPFLSTRELFHLKLDEERRNDYLQGDVPARRAILTELANQPLPPIEATVSWSEPVEVETLEWFASPLELCALLARLYQVDEAREILQINPGVPSPLWQTIGFKGGSEPGVLTGAWIMTDDQERTWVFAGSVWNATTAFDEDPVVLALAKLRDELANS